MFGIKSLLISFCVIMFGCASPKKQSVLFELMESQQTGLHFSNTLKSSENFNLFKYMYFYNGSGLGAEAPRNREWSMTNYLETSEMVLNMGPQHPSTHGVLHRRSRSGRARERPKHRGLGAHPSVRRLRGGRPCVL